MITTRNRSLQLRSALDRIRELQPQPAEVLITADGCTDDTIQILDTESLNRAERDGQQLFATCSIGGPPGVGIKAEISNLRVIVNEVGLGSVASRAAMMERATGDLVLALDDDSYPEQLDCLTKLSELFQRDEQLAIATFPQRTDEYPETLQQSDFGAARPIRSFPNSGACLRVSTYRSLPGFEPMFFHMYEEPDYALQCVANGWKVMFFPEITIRHHWTPNQRSEIRNHHRHARNEFWSTLMRCPFPQAFGLMAYRVVSQARFALTRGPGWLLREPVWWWQAVKGIPAALRRRQPVTWDGYRKWLALPDA